MNAATVTGKPHIPTKVFRSRDLPNDAPAVFTITQEILHESPWVFLSPEIICFKWLNKQGIISHVSSSYKKTDVY